MTLRWEKILEELLQKHPPNQRELLRREIEIILISLMRPMFENYSGVTENLEKLNINDAEQMEARKKCAKKDLKKLGLSDAECNDLLK